jgi:hypothetical protein
MAALQEAFLELEVLAFLFFTYSDLCILIPFYHSFSLQKLFFPCLLMLRKFQLLPPQRFLRNERGTRPRNQQHRRSPGSQVWRGSSPNSWKTLVPCSLLLTGPCRTHLLTLIVGHISVGMYLVILQSIKTWVMYSTLLVEVFLFHKIVLSKDDMIVSAI